MAEYVQISKHFWDDDLVAYELKIEEKLLFLYLLTNPSTNLIGIYKMNIRTIETGIACLTPEQIRSGLKTLQDAGKIIYEHGYIVLRNYAKHTTYNNPMIRKHVSNQIEMLPKQVKTIANDLLIDITNKLNPNNTQSRPITDPLQTHSRPITDPNKNNASPMGVQCVPNASPTIPFHSNTNTISNPPSIPPTPGRYVKDGRHVVDTWEGKEGKEGKERIMPNSRKGKGGEIEEEVADGVWLTAKQQRELSLTYGDYGLLDSPNDVSDYIKANGIELKDAFKMCVKFCENHQKKAK